MKKIIKIPGWQTSIREIYNQKWRRFRYFLKKVTGSYNDSLPDFRRGLSDAELLVQEIVDVGDLERRTQTTRDPPQDTHPHHRQIHHHTHFSTAEQPITRNQICHHNSCFFTTSPPASTTAVHDHSQPLHRSYDINSHVDCTALKLMKSYKSHQ